MTNLIYHEDSGLIVNAKMTAAPPGIDSMNGKDRFYMYSIAFVIPQSKANIIVRNKTVFPFLFSEKLFKTLLSLFKALVKT